MMRRLIEQLGAAPEDVISEVSEGDEMYLPDRLDNYFEMGRSALGCIRLAMLTAGTQDVRSLLDFPCGHGRVMRMLKAEFPQAQLTAGDINKDGVDFCERVFGASPIYSGARATEVEINEQFDLVWCGSLLTHLGLDRWHEFFSLLSNSVERGGLFVFTAYGDWAAKRLPQGAYEYAVDESSVEPMLRDYERDGFAYADYRGEEMSGMSLTSPSWIFTQVEKEPGLRIAGYFPRAWGDHQDVVACVKGGSR